MSQSRELRQAVDAMTVVRVRAKVTGVLVQGCDLYVGRSCYRKPWHQDASKLANPYSAKQYGRQISIEKYEQHLRECPELLIILDAILIMAVDQYRKGQPMTLGCWCAPNACHADVIIKLIRERLLD